MMDRQRGEVIGKGNAGQARRPLLRQRLRLDDVRNDAALIRCPFPPKWPLVHGRHQPYRNVVQCHSAFIVDGVRGLFQWVGSRRKGFAERYGMDVMRAVGKAVRRFLSSLHGVELAGHYFLLEHGRCYSPRTRGYGGRQRPTDLGNVDRTLQCTSGICAVFRRLRLAQYQCHLTGRCRGHPKCVLPVDPVKLSARLRRSIVSVVHICAPNVWEG